MKTRVIPAQITTVEDKIAGNLNFTQILLLIASVLLNTGIYVLLPLPMKFNIYKVTLILSVFVSCGTLAFRFKDRVILNWVVLLAVYALRPKFYIFNKNNISERYTEISTSEISKKITSSTSTKTNVKSFVANNIDLTEINRNKNYGIRFNRRGVVAIKNI